MRLDHGRLRAPVVQRVRPSLFPVYGWCRCFLCGHESAIPLPLSQDQPNWIECEWCELDNEIPAGVQAEPVVLGCVPSRVF